MKHRPACRRTWLAEMRARTEYGSAAATADGHAIVTDGEGYYSKLY
jgi:hypothetical protein